MTMINCLNYKKDLMDQTQVCHESGQNLNSFSLIEDIKLKTSRSCKNEIRPLVAQADNLCQQLFEVSSSRRLPFIYQAASYVIGIENSLKIKHYMDRRRLGNLQLKIVNCLKFACPILSRSNITDQCEYIQCDVKFPINPRDPGEHALEYLVYSHALKNNADAIIIDYGETLSKVSGSTDKKALDHIYVTYIRVKD